MFSSEYENYEIILNTVYGGGAYKYLQQKASVCPILVVNLCGWKYNLPATFMFKQNTKEVMFKSLEDMFAQLKPISVSINHLIRAEDSPALINKLITLCTNTKLRIYIHDYFIVCPTINLLSSNGNFCNLPAPEDCHKCLQSYIDTPNENRFSQETVIDYRKIHQSDIVKWRNNWDKLIQIADKIVVPSNSTAKLLNCAFEYKYQNIIQVVPHIIDNLNKIYNKEATAYGPLKIAVIGDLTMHKGLNALFSLIQKIAETNLNIHITVFGETHVATYKDSPYLTVTGHFKSSELPDIINAATIDGFLFLSICPETFSYVTQEMMATGLPIIAFNLGAQAEFLKEYKNGTLIEINIDSLYENVNAMYAKHIQRRYPILLEDANNRAQIEILISDIMQLEIKNRDLSAMNTKYKNSALGFKELLRLIIAKIKNRLRAELRKISIIYAVYKFLKQRKQEISLYTRKWRKPSKSN